MTLLCSEKDKDGRRCHSKEKDLGIESATWGRDLMRTLLRHEQPPPTGAMPLGFDMFEHLPP